MKKRTMNEIRQSKEYQIALQGGDFIKPTDKPAKSTAEVMLEDQLSHANEFQLEELKGENFYRNPFEHEEVDKTVDQIVEDLQPQIFDTIFQMINDEMTKRYIFDSTEYLTEAGLELFEDEWFEFYHENHGKIMHKLIQKLK
jgi:hypothetical protein